MFSCVESFCSLLLSLFWARLQVKFSDDIVALVVVLGILGPPPSKNPRSLSSTCLMLLLLSPVVALGPPPSQIFRSHSSTCSMLFFFFPVIALGPRPSQFLGLSHAFKLLQCCFAFLLVVSGRPPSQIVKPHSSTCLMLLCFSSVLGPPSSQFVSPHSSKCSILLFFAPGCFGPTSKSTYRITQFRCSTCSCFCSFLLWLFWAHLQVNLPDHILTQCPVVNASVFSPSFEPPPSQILRSHVQCVCSCLLVLFWAHLQVKFSDHIVQGC